MSNEGKKPESDRKKNPNPYPLLDKEDANLSRPQRQGDLPLPHERDESPGKDADDRREVIEQAARDISRGLRDTDQHGVPSDVPGPGVAPEDSPGAEVPPRGVDHEIAGRRRGGKSG